MKKVKILLLLSAFAFFVACHNPYSSTSQETREESEETMEHEKRGHEGGEHEMKGESHQKKDGQHMKSDTNHMKTMDTTGTKAVADTLKGTSNTAASH